MSKLKYYNKENGNTYIFLNNVKGGLCKARNLNTNTIEVVDPNKHIWIENSQRLEVGSKLISNKMCVEKLVAMKTPQDKIDKIVEEANNLSNFIKSTGDKVVKLMMHTADVNVTDNPEVVRLKFTKEFCDYHNHQNKLVGRTNMISPDVEICVAMVELMHDWFSITKVDGVFYNRMILTDSEGHKIDSIRTVEVEKEVIKKVIETKVVKQEIKSGIDKTKLEKEANKFLKTKQKNLNQFAYQALEQGLLEFINNLK
jgi:hypothetical protein